MLLSGPDEPCRRVARSRVGKDLFLTLSVSASPPAASEGYHIVNTHDVNQKSQMITNSQLEELKPNIARLQAIGCELLDTEDQGAFGYIATFRKANWVFSIVKDRGVWYLHGPDMKLNQSPCRKSRGLVEKDVIAWLEANNARVQE